MSFPENKKIDEESISKKLVSIIILNYNAGDLLVDCISSILKSHYKNFEIILVDNVSSDQSHKKCKEKFPTINLIENSENLGYCEGNNVGLREARGKFVVVLNPDTIVDSYWLDELLKAYETNGEGLYQPKFLATTDHSMLLSTGNMIQIFGFGYSRSKGEKDKQLFEKFEQIDYASGTCLFTSRALIEKIGLFESFLFAFHDDLELCWRGAIMNIHSFYVPKSIVYHPKEGYSFKWSPIKFKLMERNRKYCLLTLYDRCTLLKMLPSLLIIDVAVLFFYVTRGIGKMKILADWEILRNLKIINSKYAQNQKIKCVPDSTLLKQFKNELLVPAWVLDQKKNNLFNNFLISIAKITKRFFR
ncbi:MAG: glycosyltransferase family 2 protein [Candidatus Nitrosopumilus sp. bin_68KS]